MNGPKKKWFAYSFSCWKQRTTDKIAIKIARITPGSATENANSSMYVRCGSSFMPTESQTGNRSRSGFSPSFDILSADFLSSLIIWNAHQSNLNPAFSNIVWTEVRLYVHVAILYNGFTSSCNSIKRFENAVCDDRSTTTLKIYKINKSQIQLFRGNGLKLKLPFSLLWLNRPTATHFDGRLHEWNMQIILTFNP